MSAFEKWWSASVWAASPFRDSNRPIAQSAWDACADEAALAVKGIKDRRAIRALKTAKDQGRGGADRERCRQVIGKQIRVVK